MPKKRPPNAEATQFRSGEQAVENGRKGERNSGISRNHTKDLREALQILMDTDLTGKDGKKITGAEAMAAKVFQEALKGDWKAWELARDTAGQKPVDKVMVADVEPSVIAEVEAMVKSE